MACRGVLFSIDQEAADALLGLDSDEARAEHIQQVIEEDYFANRSGCLAETEKSWYRVHRVPTDGNLEWDNGTYRWNHVIVGGELLHEGSDNIVTTKPPPSKFPNSPHRLPRSSRSRSLTAFD